MRIYDKLTKHGMITYYLQNSVALKEWNGEHQRKFQDSNYIQNLHCHLKNFSMKIGGFPIKITKIMSLDHPYTMQIFVRQMINKHTEYYLWVLWAVKVLMHILSEWCKRVKSGDQWCGSHYQSISQLKFYYKCKVVDIPLKMRPSLWPWKPSPEEVHVAGSCVLSTFVIHARMLLPPRQQATVLNFSFASKTL